MKQNKKLSWYMEYYTPKGVNESVGVRIIYKPTKAEFACERFKTREENETEVRNRFEKWTKHYQINLEESC